MGLILIIGYMGYQKLIARESTIDISQYSLAKADETPIPKEVIFKLWQEAALKFCSNYRETDVSLTKHTSEQCKDRVNQKHLDCEQSLMIDSPNVISEKSISRQLGEKYFSCALPGIVCNGVETRSEEEAIRLCQ